MTTTAQTATTKTYSEHSAQACFIAHETNIDEALTILTEASADHFGVHPDDVTWAHCGDLQRAMLESW